MLRNIGIKIGFLLLILFVFPWVVFGETETFENLGFVQDTVWFSKDPFFAPDTVRIYSAIFNSTPHDLKGTAEFFVDEKGIGEASFTATRQGGIGIAWIDWQSQEGDHAFSAQIKEAKLSVIGQEDRIIVLKNSIGRIIQRFVDKDADQDEVGDVIDPDDDNDSLLDEEELRIGTNPYSQDTDEDGIADGADSAPLFAHNKEQGGAPLLKGQEGQPLALQEIVGRTENAVWQMIERIDAFALVQHERLEGTKKEIRSLLNKEEDSGKKTIDFDKMWGYGAFATVSFSSFFFDHTLLLYLLLLFVGFKGVMMLWRRVVQ